MNSELELEFEALKAIYDDNCVIDGRHVVFVFKKIELRINIPLEYPKVLPHLSISVPRALEEAWIEEIGLVEMIGSPMLFIAADFVERKIEAFVDEQQQDEKQQQVLQEQQDDFGDVEIFVGEQIKDRKSKFIAYSSKCKTSDECQRFKHALLQRFPNCQNATHNIMAYKLANGDCYRDDDGENNAGDKLLYLLDVMKVEDICVIVSRWYGGVHLGPDRFKHIW